MFPNLHFESLYLQGARDILLRLKDDFDMYLIPLIQCKMKPSEFFPKEATNLMWFPLNNPYRRKLIGKGLLNTLINDRESLKNFIQGIYSDLHVTAVKRDKKGKITELTIKIE